MHSCCFTQERSFDNGKIAKTGWMHAIEHEQNGYRVSAWGVLKKGLFFALGFIDGQRGSDGMVICAQKYLGQ